VKAQSQIFKNFLIDYSLFLKSKEKTARDFILSGKTKSSLFQVLLIDNGENEDVQVQESKDVDFTQVKEHLKNGGSVFITSKDSQKIEYPRNLNQQNYNCSRRRSGLLLRQRLRN
jgi:hypothetical protein